MRLPCIMTLSINQLGSSIHGKTFNLLEEEQAYSIADSHSLHGKNVRLIDPSVAGNRLVQTSEKTVEMRMKSLPEVFGEQIVSPLLQKSKGVGRRIFALLQNGAGTIDRSLSRMVNFLPTAQAKPLASAPFLSRKLFSEEADNHYNFHQDFPSSIDLSQHFNNTDVRFENLNFRVFMKPQGKEHQLPSNEEILRKDLSSNLPCFAEIDGFVLKFTEDQAMGNGMGGECVKPSQSTDTNYVAKIVAIAEDDRIFSEQITIHFDTDFSWYFGEAWMTMAYDTIVVLSVLMCIEVAFRYLSCFGVLNKKCNNTEQMMNMIEGIFQNILWLQNSKSKQGLEGRVIIFTSPYLEVSITHKTPSNKTLTDGKFTIILRQKAQPPVDSAPENQEEYKKYLQYVGHVMASLKDAFVKQSFEVEPTLEIETMTSLNNKEEESAIEHRLTIPYDTAQRNLPGILDLTKTRNFDPERVRFNMYNRYYELLKLSEGSVTTIFDLPNFIAAYDGQYSIDCCPQITLSKTLSAACSLASCFRFCLGCKPIIDDNRISTGKLVEILKVLLRLEDTTPLSQEDQAIRNEAIKLLFDEIQKEKQTAIQANTSTIPFAREKGKMVSMKMEEQKKQLKLESSRVEVEQQPATGALMEPADSKKMEEMLEAIAPYMVQENHSTSTTARQFATQDILDGI